MWICWVFQTHYILNAYFETYTLENSDQYLAYFKEFGPVHSKGEAALLLS